ncbi:phospholipase C/P1 nuclease domain-containing protein [Aspergillus avenaceus]|uniref:Phospholipase C/P1 nuclease domain-containing protein n=1 Tax=Aspergillus avenaceus TaxID=36643 RepID=A0A5N6U333_ASPAV|nr:phospholipase C/P1 nuclease domain-containing protein [Aspergillus avenaceus]
MARFSLLAVALAQLQLTHAWGNLGHETVAYIAQNFVASSTKSFCQKILGDDSTSYLANVATWADSYKYTDAGEFSKVFHYIDALDDPPKSCGVDYDRDCGDAGCSISAMLNYTNILLDSPDSSEAVDALKFVVHIIGDTHQPLHDENLEVGGNGIDVIYDGEETNLHHIWDSNMPEDAAGGYTPSVAKSYAQLLTTRITTGAYSSKKTSWTSGIDIDDPVATSMIWARDANGFVCTTVLDDGLAYINSTDLSGDYYDKSQPVFEELIAKAGYRLAAWLDLIAEHSS